MYFKLVFNVKTRKISKKLINNFSAIQKFDFTVKRRENQKKKKIRKQTESVKIKCQT